MAVSPNNEAVIYVGFWVRCETLRPVEDEVKPIL
jgi:hypothetical protein